MPFFDFLQVPLEDFRPGIKSLAHFGKQLLLVVMTIEAGRHDPGHAHPFDQCGWVLEGGFRLTIGEESRQLGPGQGYFIPANTPHSWAAGDKPVRVVDVTYAEKG
jgi:quercetin dioxygenase-like cupin family protein